MIDDKLTSAELQRLAEAGVEYPWHPRQTIRALDEIARLQAAQSNSTDRDYALMEAALRTYGRHTHNNCNSPIYPSGGLSRDMPRNIVYRPCECGLDAALDPERKP